MAQSVTSHSWSPEEYIVDFKLKRNKATAMF